MNNIYEEIERLDQSDVDLFTEISNAECRVLEHTKEIRLVIESLMERITELENKLSKVGNVFSNKEIDSTLENFDLHEVTEHNDNFQSDTIWPNNIGLK